MLCLLLLFIYFYFIYFIIISGVRIEGGIIPTVLVQRGRGVVRNLKKRRSTREDLPLSLPQSLLLHVKVNGIN